MPAVTVADYGGMAGQPLGATGYAPMKLAFGTFTVGSYATGGVDLTGLTKYFGALVGVSFLIHAVYDFIYVPATGKVWAYVKTTGAQCANAVDLSGVTLQFIAFGRA